jgi:hypothetical protein
MSPCSDCSLASGWYDYSCFGLSQRTHKRDYQIKIVGARLLGPCAAPTAIGHAVGSEDHSAWRLHCVSALGRS